MKYIAYLTFILLAGCELMSEAQPTPNPAKPCLNCGIWKANNPFPGSTIAAGTYTLEMIADDINASYPGDNAITINVENMSDAEVSVTFSDALNGNGIFTVKKNMIVSCNDLFHPTNANCVYTPTPRIGARMNLSNYSSTPATLKISISMSSTSCIEGFSPGKSWIITLSP